MLQLALLVIINTQSFWWTAHVVFSFNKLLLQKEELEQKHLHLLQIVESEKTAKWQYSQQCDELTTEIKKLRNEVSRSDMSAIQYPH